jgi:O-antigen ligase
MILSARLNNGNLSSDVKAQQPRHLSALMFFKKYPIFLLAFGPPLFRPLKGIDITRGELDIWSYLQVGLIVLVSIPAILRLLYAESITIPAQVRSILRLAFFLGFLFLLSTIYTTSRFTTVSYSICYLLTLLCMVDFIAQANHTPPNWMQCIYQLRFVSFILLLVAIMALFIDPMFVMSVTQNEEIRFSGSNVAPVSVICPIIVIISVHSFLYRLESKVKSVLCFLVGMAGTLLSQSRGSELALVFALAIIGLFWAKAKRQTAYIFISGSLLFICLSGFLVGSIGAGRIWSIFNRGQDVRGIESASGRIEIWTYVIQYCITHPWGMGYIAGFRTLFRNYYSLWLTVDVTHIGGAHNSFIQVLADAGWLALAVYLIMIVKVIAIGWRAAKVSSSASMEFVSTFSHMMACAMALLFFCLVNGMTTTDFIVPLRASFYFQNIIIAIILCAFAKMIYASRRKYIASVE